MKQVLLFVTILLSAAVASANTVTIEWAFPTDQEANISGFSIYMRSDGGDYPDNPAASSAADERMIEIGGLADGTYWFCITAAISIYEAESARSGEVGISFSNGEVSYPFSVTSPAIIKIQGATD